MTFRFAVAIAKPIEFERYQKALEKFRSLTDPFIIRRVKTDKTIISDLPEKIVSDQFCVLTKQQAALYQAQVEQVMDQVEQKQGIERTGLVFKLITSLKQICNHPRQFLKKGELKPEHSGKAKVLLELLDTLYLGNQKVLIFTQYTQMGKLLGEMITQQFKRPPLFFHGGLNRRQRDQHITTFQQEPQTDNMILSLKAGGTGLNLTAASAVVHYDLWWNPTVETQATDQAYRIGQDKTVNVYRLITQNTFEEKINAMINNKKELADLTVRVGRKRIGELSNNELKELFKLE